MKNLSKICIYDADFADRNTLDQMNEFLNSGKVNIEINSLAELVETEGVANITTDAMALIQDVILSNAEVSEENQTKTIIVIPEQDYSHGVTLRIFGSTKENDTAEDYLARTFGFKYKN